MIKKTNPPSHRICLLISPEICATCHQSHLDALFSGAIILIMSLLLMMMSLKCNKLPNHTDAVQLTHDIWTWRYEKNGNNQRANYVCVWWSCESERLTCIMKKKMFPATKWRLKYIWPVGQWRGKQKRAQKENEIIIINSVFDENWSKKKICHIHNLKIIDEMFNHRWLILIVIFSLSILCYERNACRRACGEE